MAKYKLTDNGIQNTETGAFIPDDAGNRDWREYQRWLAAGNTPDPQYTLPEAQAKKVTEVKAEAARRILDIAPEWKQRNLMARATELQELRTVNGNLTTEEQAELDAIWVVWSDIKAVREASNTIEAEITDTNKYPTADDVLAVDVAGHPAWS